MAAYPRNPWRVFRPGLMIAIHPHGQASKLRSRFKNATICYPRCR